MKYTASKSNHLKEIYLDYLNSNEAKSAIRYSNEFEVFYELMFSQVGEYTSIENLISVENIELYRNHRKSRIGRSVLTGFMDCLHSVGEVSYEESLTLKDRVLQVYGKNNKESKFEYEFLNIEEISNLFSLAEYKDYDIELAHLIYVLSYHCYFEQWQIIDLEIEEIDFTNKRIKNNRVNKHPELIHWIELSDEVFDYVTEYYDKYKGKITRKFVIFEGMPIDTSKINKCYHNLKRVHNSKLFRFTLNTQILIRSGMLHRIIESNGQNYFKLQSLTGGNKQLNAALDRFIDYKKMNVFGDSIAVGSLAAAGVIDPEIFTDNMYNPTPPRSDSKVYDINLDVTLEELMNFDSFKPMEKKQDITIQRLVRNTSLATELKNRYNNQCQLCGYRLRNRDGSYYSEAHHIKPFNKIHLGEDKYSNMLVLCPNCHTQFDQLYYAIKPTDSKVYSIFEDDQFNESELDFISEHKLCKESLEYVWSLFKENNN